MDDSKSTRKRKAVTREVETVAAVASGDEFEIANLDSTLADSDESGSGGGNSDDEANFEDHDDSEQENEDSGSLTSDEILSDSDEDHNKLKKLNESNKPTLGITTNNSDGRNEEDEDESEKLNYKIVKDANGNERYVYDEIDPDDDSEYSVGEEEQNTIGNIPLSYYDSYPHIGYNINGKKVMRPAKGEALDALLDSIEVPKGWTGLTDPSTGKPLELSQEELQLLRKKQMNEIPADGYDPYEPTVEWFTSKVEIMPLNAAPEPKRRFIPSKHEAKRVMKIVRAIREGHILPYRPPLEEEDDSEIQNYDIWTNEQPRPDHAMHMPAPKLPPPGFDESYHPPAEYLPDQKDRQEWEQTDPEDREREYLPSDHDSLRKVPGYSNFLEERFERCLDLYLAPRVRRHKLNIDPDSLLPKLPNPDELRPFPSACAALYREHAGRVRTLAVDPAGLYLATGGDDGTIRFWEVITGRRLHTIKLDSDSAINVIRWRPTKETLVLAAAAGDSVYFCIPPDLDPEREATSHVILDAGFGHASDSSTAKSKAVAWTRPASSLSAQGVHLVIPLGPSHTAKSVSFHPAGNHLVTVCPSPSLSISTAIAIHTVSKHLTQHPFTKRLKGGGPPQIAHFHPTKPTLFVANQRVIRSYDLSRQMLLKIIQPGARWISSFSIHPTSSSISGSDNLIVGSYDRRLLWMDLDLSPRPYKTLRYHEKAIRSVKFHPNPSRYPLFADGSDDGSVQVFHGSVTSDVMSNARIVPLKVLRGHRVGGDGLGVMDIDWHPSLPWLVSAGGDGTVRLWI